MKRQRCFFEISYGVGLVGRLEFELYTDIVPKTAENFRALCTGFQADECTKLSYENTIFHRVIDKYIIQGGKIATEGEEESIYGGMFDDECLTTKHDQPFLLSMANKGPNTNGSQFFITTSPAPHLDGIHVVFGRVTMGHKLVKRIEAVAVDRNNRPLEDVRVTRSGELIYKSHKKSKRSKSPKSDRDLVEPRAQSDRNDEYEAPTSIKPEDIPPTPPQRFLFRGNSNRSDPPSSPLDRRDSYRARRDRTSKSGRKMKGRGVFRYRTPSPSARDDNSSRPQRSGTPPYWRQEERRNIKLGDLVALKEKRNRDDMPDRHRDRSSGRRRSVSPHRSSQGSDSLGRRVEELGSVALRYPPLSPNSPNHSSSEESLPPRRVRLGRREVMFEYSEAGREALRLRVEEIKKQTGEEKIRKSHSDSLTKNTNSASGRPMGATKEASGKHKSLVHSDKGNDDLQKKSTSKNRSETNESVKPVDSGSDSGDRKKKASSRKELEASEIMSAKRKSHISDSESDDHEMASFRKESVASEKMSSKRKSRFDNDDDDLKNKAAARKETDFRAKRKPHVSELDSDNYEKAAARKETDVRAKRKPHVSDSDSDQYEKAASKKELDARAKRQHHVSDSDSDHFEKATARKETDVKAKRKSEVSDSESDHHEKMGSRKESEASIKIAAKRKSHSDYKSDDRKKKVVSRKEMSSKRKPEVSDSDSNDTKKFRETWKEVEVSYSTSGRKVRGSDSNGEGYPQIRMRKVFVHRVTGSPIIGGHHKNSRSHARRGSRGGKERDEA